MGSSRWMATRDWILQHWDGGCCLQRIEKQRPQIPPQCGARSDYPHRPYRHQSPVRSCFRTARLGPRRIHTIELCRIGCRWRRAVRWTRKLTADSQVKFDRRQKSWILLGCGKNGNRGFSVLPSRADASLASRGHGPEKSNGRRIGISITSSNLGRFLRRSSSCRISPSALPRDFRR